MYLEVETYANGPSVNNGKCESLEHILCNRSPTKSQVREPNESSPVQMLVICRNTETTLEYFPVPRRQETMHEMRAS